MYVRTKDGRIIDTEKKYEPLQWAEQASDYALTIAQADTIEELCDEFVLIEPRDDGGKKYSHRDKESFIRDYIGYEHIDIVLSYYTIYGAIWTDKGLIYVAKMNENGDLELI